MEFSFNCSTKKDGSIRKKKVENLHRFLEIKRGYNSGQLPSTQHPGYLK
jgi:hypothetical protein